MPLNGQTTYVIYLIRYMCMNIHMTENQNVSQSMNLKLYFILRIAFYRKNENF